MMMMMMIGNLSNFVNCSLEIQESLESTLTLLCLSFTCLSFTCLSFTCLSLTRNNKVFRAHCSRKKKGGIGILGKFVAYPFENARPSISVGATQIQVITRHASMSVLFLLQFHADHTSNTNFRFVTIFIFLWVILNNTLHFKYILFNS